MLRLAVLRLAVLRLAVWVRLAGLAGLAGLVAWSQLDSEQLGPANLPPLH